MAAVISAVRGQGGRRVSLQFLQRQLELVGLGAEMLGGLAELHSAQPSELEPETAYELELAGYLGLLRQHDGA